MKKLFLALALLAFFTPGAFAASCDPNTDRMTNGEWCINTNSVLIPSSSAGQQVIVENYTAKGVNNTLAATESGKTIVDTGGGTGVLTYAFGSKHILPRAAAGLTYKICTGVRGVNGIVATVDTVDTDDTIEVSISGTMLDAGDSLKSTGQAGECVTLTSTVANKWNAEMDPAVWTDNGTN